MFFMTSVCQDWHNKEPQTEWLKQQKFILSQFWRQKCESRGVQGPGLFQVWLLASGSSLACGSTTPVFAWSSPCMCVLC